MRIVKQRLLEMMPDASVFLGASSDLTSTSQLTQAPRAGAGDDCLCCTELLADVDDLKEGKGAEYVDVALVVLVFASRGYFQSANWSATACTCDT